MGSLQACSLSRGSSVSPLPFEPLSVGLSSSWQGLIRQPLSGRSISHRPVPCSPQRSSLLTDSNCLLKDSTISASSDFPPLVNCTDNLASERVNRKRRRGLAAVISGSWQRGRFLSEPSDVLRERGIVTRSLKCREGVRVLAQSSGSGGGDDKDGDDLGTGNGRKQGEGFESFMEGPQKVPTPPSNQGSVQSQEDQEYDKFLENLQEAYNALRKEEVDLSGFLRLVVKAFFQDSATREFLKSTDWYDVDGNKVTEWTQERIDTVLQAKIGVVLEGFLGLQAGENVKRVDWMMEKELRRNIFANSPFEVTAVEQGVDGSRCFYGELTGDAEEAYGILHHRISTQYPDLVLILSREDSYDTPTCYVAYKDTFLLTPGVTRELCLGSLVLVLISSNSLLRTDPALITGGAALWNGLLFPLGLLVVMLSSYAGQALCSLAYGIPISPFYLPLPAPGLGLVGLPWKDKCLLPNRACLIDQALASSAATCIASLALMATKPPPVPFYLRLLASDFGWSETAGALKDVVLINAGTFQSSAVMSEFASHLATATYEVPSGESLMAIGPFALAGLVGVNMTALNLVPFGVMNGGRIIAGIGGGIILLICSLITAIVVILYSLADIHSFWPWFGLGIAFVGVSAYEMQRNELSSPGPWRAMLGLGFVGMGAFTLLPISVFYAIFSTGPGILVEQLGAALSLFPIR